ncbi:MAG: helix-turn-helix domain-containing protein [Nitrospirota bacterium]
MPRLDARVKVQFPAQCFSRKGGVLSEKKVLVEELSLSGALISNLSAGFKSDLVIIKASLAGCGEIDVIGEVVRASAAGVAVAFYCHDVNTQATLWEYIKERLSTTGRCPYCGKRLRARPEHCPNCGWLLNFRDSAYLVKHALETRAPRLLHRARRCDPEQIQKVLTFMDAELLRAKGVFLNRDLATNSACFRTIFSSILTYTRDMCIWTAGENTGDTGRAAPPMRGESTARYPSLRPDPGGARHDRRSGAQGKEGGRAGAAFDVPGAFANARGDRHAGLCRALRYIDKNYTKPRLTLTQVTKEAGMSISCFERTFKEWIGVTFKTFVNKLRVARAMEMLREGGFSMSEIAHACGFSSQFYFARVFKKITTITPREFRKAHLLNGLPPENDPPL